jgi:hypothetical protein
VPVVVLPEAASASVSVSTVGTAAKPNAESQRVERARRREMICSSVFALMLSLALLRSPFFDLISSVVAVIDLDQISGPLTTCVLRHRNIGGEVGAGTQKHSDR